MYQDRFDDSVWQEEMIKREQMIADLEKQCEVLEKRYFPKTGKMLFLVHDQEFGEFDCE